MVPKKKPLSIIFNFSYEDSEASCFMGISFCGEDNNFCVAFTGEPTWEIILVDLKRMSILSSLKLN